MGQIRVLPATLVNRIAAGECVERPASVVKELMENSLDAGASRIDVEVLDGGRALVRVTDDGIGMDPDDLRLSVTPHATSKISTDDDLFNIHTMGFRGEALPSIGSVSRMTITSRRATADVAHAIKVEAGEVGELTPCAAPAGTSIAVEDLFFCVPARRKFLRTNSTEMGHITETFARCALAHPSVSFSLRHQSRELHRLAPVKDRQQRIADFYGAEIADGLLAVARDGRDVRVEGYVAPPQKCRRSTKWEYVFVNGRYVRDRFVGHAIKSAYRGLIQGDEYPVVFLFITVEPAQVDVNVHPTKVEVRWRDSNYVHAQVLAAIRDRFLSTNLDRSYRTPARDDEYRERVRSAMVDFFRNSGSRAEEIAPSNLRSPAAAGGEIERAREREIENSEGRRGAASDDLMAMRRPVQETDDRVEEALPAYSQPAEVTPEHADWRHARALQIHNTYLAVETDDGMMIIDQHALHERILYEELRRRITEKPLESQRLLIPEVVNVAPDRIEVLETHAETLARLGVELVPVGPRSVALQSFPFLLERMDPSAFVRDLLDLLSEAGQRPDTETLVHHVLDMMACKAAVKAGDPLTPEECTALLARREMAERSSHCPHGRPTTLHLSLRDLERQFKRR